MQLLRTGLFQKSYLEFFSKLLVNVSNLSWDWLGDLYKDTILQNLLPIFNSKTIHSCK